MNVFDDLVDELNASRMSSILQRSRSHVLIGEERDAAACMHTDII